MGTEDSDGGVEDCISGLPDDLLLSILVRVADTAAAARTSVLSHRWRHLWVHLPKLSFRSKYGRYQISARARAHERVAAALAARAGTTTTVTLLEVTLPRWAPQASVAVDDDDIGDEKAAAPPWLLQFASQRVAGELRLSLRHGHDNLSRQSGAEIVVPPCERATAITLDVDMLPLRFVGGTFAALATLRILKARVYSREVQATVSSRCCPRLKDLVLKCIALHDEPPVLSILSDSLERFEIVGLATARIKVIAPKLEILLLPTRYRISGGVHIVAPKLLEVCWYGLYDPISDSIMKAGRHLQRLKICMPMNLMLRFDTVHELQLTFEIWRGTECYQRYLEDVDKLSKFEVLVLVKFSVAGHAIRPALLHLLKKCSGVKKIVVHNFTWHRISKCGCIPGKCQCGPWAPGHGEDDIVALDLLEHVEIGGRMETYHKVEFVTLLCQYSATFRKKVTVTIIENNKYIEEELHSICVPNDKLVINVQSSTQAGLDLKGFATSKR